MCQGWCGQEGLSGGCGSRRRRGTCWQEGSKRTLLAAGPAGSTALDWPPQGHQPVGAWEQRCQRAVRGPAGTRCCPRRHSRPLCHRRFSTAASPQLLHSCFTTLLQTLGLQDRAAGSAGWLRCPSAAWRGQGSSREHPVGCAPAHGARPLGARARAPEAAAHHASSLTCGSAPSPPLPQPGQRFHDANEPQQPAQPLRSSPGLAAPRSHACR